MEKPGVVIFNNDYSDEGLAALQWASSVFANLSNKPHVHILFVEKTEDKTTVIGKKCMSKEELCGLADPKAKEKFPGDQTRANNPLDRYINKFNDKADLGRSCEGANIQETLEKAIEEVKLDTLVLGMAALGSTSKKGLIDLQLKSKCSVVLVKIDQKPLKTRFEIPPPDKEQTAGTSSAGNEVKRSKAT